MGVTARLSSGSFAPGDFSADFDLFVPGERPIRPSDYDAAAAVWAACVATIVNARYDRGTISAAELRRAAGVAVAAGGALMRSLSFGAAARDLVNAARLAGVDHRAFADVRQTIAAMRAGNGLGAMVLALFVRLCLAAEARALCDEEFSSRQDVDAAIAAMRVAFEDVMDYAAERGASDVFQAFSTLYSDTIRDLTERALSLPKMASYATVMIVPSLRLACRLYDDAGRSVELSSENKVVNPLFMPASGRALAF